MINPLPNPMNKDDENFIKDFNYRFNQYFSWTMNQEAKAELIAYLDKVRKEERQSLIEKIKGKKMNSSYDGTDWDSGYDYAMDKIINLLQEK